MIVVALSALLAFAGAPVAPESEVRVPIARATTGRLFVAGREVRSPVEFDAVGRFVGRDTTWRLEVGSMAFPIERSYGLADSLVDGYVQVTAKLTLCGGDPAQNRAPMYPLAPNGAMLLREAEGTAYRATVTGRVESLFVSPAKARRLMVDMLRASQPCVVAAFLDDSGDVHVTWGKRMQRHAAAPVERYRPFTDPFYYFHPVVHYSRAVAATVDSLAKDRVLVIDRAGRRYLCPRVQRTRLLAEIERLSAGQDPIRPRVLPRAFADEFNPEIH